MQRARARASLPAKLFRSLMEWRTNLKKIRSLTSLESIRCSKHQNDASLSLSWILIYIYIFCKKINQTKIKLQKQRKEEIFSHEYCKVRCFMHVCSNSTTNHRVPSIVKTKIFEWRNFASHSFFRRGLWILNLKKSEKKSFRLFLQEKGKSSPWSTTRVWTHSARTASFHRNSRWALQEMPRSQISFRFFPIFSFPCTLSTLYHLLDDYYHLSISHWENLLYFFTFHK